MKFSTNERNVAYVLLIFSKRPTFLNEFGNSRVCFQILFTSAVHSGPFDITLEGEAECNTPTHGRY